MDEVTDDELWERVLRGQYPENLSAWPKWTPPEPQPGICDNCNDQALLSQIYYQLVSGQMGIWQLCEPCQRLMGQKALGIDVRRS